MYQDSGWVREGWGDPTRTSWLQPVLQETNLGSGIATTKEPSSFCNSISEGDLAISSGCLLHIGEVLGGQNEDQIHPYLLGPRLHQNSSSFR